MSLIARL